MDRVQLSQCGLLFTFNHKSPGCSDTHLFDLGVLKGRVNIRTQSGFESETIILESSDLTTRS